MNNSLQEFENENEKQISKLRTKLELDRIREERQKLSIKKAERIIGFIGTKITGIGSIGFGICELISPDLISVNTDKPLAYVATGLALLTGKRVIEIVNKISKSLNDEL
jgi:hypothetical protein